MKKLISATLFSLFLVSPIACKGGGSMSLDPKVQACNQSCDSARGQCEEECTGEDAEACKAACKVGKDQCVDKCKKEM